MMIVDESMRQMYAVKVEVDGTEGEILFDIKSESGAGSAISLDGGKTWFPALMACLACRAFEVKFPRALDEDPLDAEFGEAEELGDLDLSS